MDWGEDVLGGSGLSADGLLTEQSRSWLDRLYRTKTGTAIAAKSLTLNQILSASPARRAGTGSVWKGSELVCLAAKSSEACNSAEHVHARKQLTFKYQIARRSISP